MSYTIVSDICEGVGDCIPVCPVECIHWTEKTNVKGHKYPTIDDSTCIDCGACLSACPVEGAILDDWQPELQKPQSRSHNRIEIAAFAPVSPVCTVTIQEPRPSASAFCIIAKAYQKTGHSRAAPDRAQFEL